MKKSIILVSLLYGSLWVFSFINRYQIQGLDILLDSTRVQVRKMEDGEGFNRAGIMQLSNHVWKVELASLDHAFEGLMASKENFLRLLSVRPVVVTNNWHLVQRFPIPDPVPPATNATHFTNYVGVQLEPVLATNYEYHLGFTQNGTNKTVLVLVRDH